MAPQWVNERTMSHKGFFAQIMEAVRLTGEGVHGLPQGTALPVWPADAFLKTPENWMKGPGVFVVPVQPNKGLWFSWTANSKINTAIIPTVKGCNPITGMQTSGFHLERYENKCPKHGKDFLADRFCPDCNYKWPDRNYVSTNGSGELWWDGFRADDGNVRQFFFTEDELRDIASTVIKEAVPAFGFAFYSPKERRPEASTTTRGALYDMKFGGSCTGFSNTGSLGWCTTELGESTWGSVFPPILHLNSATHNAVYMCNTSTNTISTSNSSGTKMSKMTKGIVRSKSIVPDSMSLISDGNVGLGEATSDREIQVTSFVPVKEVSVGAGAKIAQELPADQYALDTWKDTPDSVMTVYFVFQEAFDQMKAGGMRDLIGNKEGFLAGCIVG